MKAYIEIETTSDKLCLIALDEVLRQIKSCTYQFTHLIYQKGESRRVICHAATTDQFGGVMTAALVNKLDKCGCDDPEREYWNS